MSATNPAATVPNLWRHKKTGNIYHLVQEAMLESDQTPVVIYEAIGPVWVRPASEFYEKFEKVTA